MISNAEYFAQDQDLADAYAAGEMTRADYIAARVALADEWAVPATLAAQVVDFTDQQRTVLDQIGLLNLTGAVASVGDLPGGAANGDTYLVNNNGHAYLRLTGVWKDLGPYGGRGGVAVFSVEGEPAAGLGVAGDLALDLETGDFYGPKTSSGWGAPILATGLQAKVSAAAAAKADAEDARDLALAARDDVVDRIDPGISLRDTDSLDWALAVLDQNDKNAGGWLADGTFSAPKVDLPQTAKMAGAPLEDQLVPAGIGSQLEPLGDEAGYAFVVLDSAGRVKFAVPISGPIVARVTKAVSVEGLDPGTVGFTELSDDLGFEGIEGGGSEYAFVIYDNAGRVKLGVPKSGPVMARVTKAVSVETIDPGVVGFAELAPEIELEPVPVEVDDRYALLLLDQAGRIKFAVPKSGPILGTIAKAVQAAGVAAGGVSLEALGSDVVERLASNRYIAQLTGSSPSRKVFVSDRLTGRRILIAATDPSEPRIVDDAFVRFIEAGAEVYQPAMGGATWPVYPTLVLTLFGDSLTNSSLGVSAVGSELGITTVNRGISGQGIADIAIRQGGLRPAITVTGNQIPASGPVTVTAILPATGYRVDAGYSFVGELAGIAGTLARDDAGGWTFTRTSSGSVAACPAGSAFTCSVQSVPAQNDVQCIWTGRNNLSNATFHEDLLACTALMVGFLKPLIKRYVVISVTNGTSEGIGTSTYDKIVAANAALAEIYGEFFYDLRTDFIQNGLAAAGITPTSDDLAAIALDRPPPSLMADPIHPNTDGYRAQKLLFAAWLILKGYFQ